MKKTNLHILLESFDKYELNKLRKFIVSPYFNKSEKIITLFDLLKPDILKNKIRHKQYYFSKIYISEEYDDQKYRNLSSDLLQLILNFLAQEKYENNPSAKANYLLESTKERGLKDIVEKSISTAYKWMQKVKLRNSDFFLQSYNLENNIFKLSSDYEKKTKIKKNEREIDILKINDYLDYFYMTEKLRYYNSYLSWKTMTKIDYEFPYIDKVLAIVKTYKTVLPPALQIYYEIYKISTNPGDQSSYYKLKELINSYLHLFDQYEANMMYSFLINFAIKQVNKGNSEFNDEFLAVYTQGIESEAILENGEISPTSFRNVISIALRSGKIEWTKSFINEKINLVPIIYRENALKFNNSRVYYYEKNFTKVIETIREVEFKDPLYAHMSKSMILLSYYELFDESTMLYFAESFYAYMRRSKGISEVVRKRYLNFIKYLKKLNKARYNPKILPSLKSDIIAEKHLASRDWFLEKLKDVKLPHDQ